MPSSPFGEPLSPTLRLLVQISHPQWNAQGDATDAALDESVDVAVLAELAHEHGLSSLLYSRLYAVSSHTTREQLSALKTAGIASAQQSLILANEMWRLVPRLQADGIDCFVFKGPTLAYTLYGSLGLRPFGDLDMMVRPEQVAAAWSVLESEGYRLAYDISRAQLPALLRSHNHLSFYGSSNNELVELHWTFFPRSRSAQFDVAGAWARRVPFEMNDERVWTLAPFDLIHFLYLHGFKHGWGRLNWLTDVAWFVCKYPQFDWGALLEHAARWGTQRMTLVGLMLAKEVYGVEFGPDVREQLARDVEATTLAHSIWQRLVSGANELPTGLELVRLTARSRERRRDGARDLYYQFMSPRMNTFEDAGKNYSLARLLFLLRKYRPLQK